ncbi:hypothetical protein PFISCL1PPCAC_15955, partial [Pristionchus fissidentatus]
SIGVSGAISNEELTADETNNKVDSNCEEDHLGIYKWHRNPIILQQRCETVSELVHFLNNLGHQIIIINCSSHFTVVN